MDMYMNNNFHIFDEVIVGSGLVARSYARSKSNSKQLVVAPTLTRFFKNFQLNGEDVISGASAEGLGRSWHGIIPLKYVSERTVQVMKCWYKHIDLDAKNFEEHNRFFVPYVPIRPKHIKLSNHVSFMDALVHSIEDKDTYFELKTDHNVVHCKKVVIAAGTVASYSILSRSCHKVRNLFKFKTTMDDHVSVYLGQGSRKFETDKIFHKSGFSFRGLIFDDAVVFQRPAHFDFKNQENVRNRSRGWADSPLNLIVRIFKSFSVGLISEAMYNKLGISPFKDLIFNYYCQMKVKDLFILDNQHWKMDAGKLNAIHERIGELRRELGIGGSFEAKLGAGLHYSHNIEQLSGFDKIVILDSSSSQLDGPFHNTFKLCCRAFLMQQ